MCGSTSRFATWSFILKRKWHTCVIAYYVNIHARTHEQRYVCKEKDTRVRVCVHVCVCVCEDVTMYTRDK